MTIADHENYAQELLSALSDQYPEAETLDFRPDPRQVRNAANAMTAILCHRLFKKSKQRPVHKENKTYEWHEGIFINRNITDRASLWTNIRRNVANEMHEAARSQTVVYLMACSSPSDETLYVWAIPEPIIYESLSSLPLKAGGAEYTVEIRTNKQRIEHYAASPELSKYFREFPLSPQELTLFQHSREVDDSVKRENKTERGEDSTDEGDGESQTDTPQAYDLEAPPATRVVFTVSRIVRETALANRVKALHNYECQICGHSIILADGSRYAEGHHVRPLGEPHNGPDVLENIDCLCPNHHASCDLGAILIDPTKFRQANGHKLSQQHIDYQNNNIFPRQSSEEVNAMSTVRVLVGTRKGAFILTSDAKRQKWDVSGPLFGGWEIYHMKGSPADPNRIYASQTSGWFGQIIQRSDDGGKTWQQPGTPAGEPTATPEAMPKAESNKFVYDSATPLTTHQWYDGTQHPWEFKRVWHLEPCLTDPETVYAGVEDAALFRSTNGGQNWQELSSLRKEQGAKWTPGAGGMGLHTIILDPTNPKRMFVAISAAGCFRTDDGGDTWKVITKGLKSNYIPDPNAQVGFCVHRIAQHRSRPNTLFMQLHWDVMRTDNAGELWTEVSGNLPSDFGFPIEVHAHEPDTVYVVPITSDSLHYPPEGKLRVYRSKTGGNEWEALTKGLPQENCYVNVLRDAMSIDTLDQCGIYFGTSGGQVYCSPDGGDNWSAIVHDLPAVVSVEVQTLA